MKGKSQAASMACPSQDPLLATLISGASSACQDLESPTQVAPEDLDGLVDAQRADASRGFPSPALAPAAHSAGLMSPSPNITPLAEVTITVCTHLQLLPAQVAQNAVHHSRANIAHFISLVPAQKLDLFVTLVRQQ